MPDSNNGTIPVLCALPWFILEKRRPGLDLPVGTNPLTVGIKQIYAAVKECWKLKQTFLYLLFYFLMSVFYSCHSVSPFMMIQGVMCSTPQCMVTVLINSMTYSLYRTVIATLQNRYGSLKLTDQRFLTDRSIVAYSTLDLTSSYCWHCCAGPWYLVSYLL